MSVPHDALNTTGSGTLLPLERKLRALVADDAPVMLEAICSVLEFQGVEVIGRAEDGLRAVTAAAKLNPELVIMDVHMPVLDGLEAAKLLAQYFPAIRIILISGDVSPELGEQCRASGADAFVFKVDFPQEVEPVVRRLFPDSRLHTVA